MRTRSLSLALILLASPVYAGSSGGTAGGGTGDVVGPASATDNAIVRFDSTTGKLVQNSAVTVADTTGDLQWEGATADTFEGNFTIADPTADWTWAWGAAGDLVGAGSLSIDNLKLDANTISTTNANGDLVLDPNGSGAVVLPQSTAFFLNVTGSDGGTGINSGGTINGIAAGGAISYQLLMTNDAWARLGSGKTINWNSATDMNSGSLDTTLSRAAAGIVKITSTLNLALLASPPRTCDATAEGDIYSDTSHALCWCDASAWQKLSGAGTCA